MATIKKIPLKIFLLTVLAAELALVFLISRLFGVSSINSLSSSDKNKILGISQPGVSKVLADVPTTDTTGGTTDTTGTTDATTGTTDATTGTTDATTSGTTDATTGTTDCASSTTCDGTTGGTTGSY